MLCCKEKDMKILVCLSVRANTRPTSFTNTPLDSLWGGSNESQKIWIANDTLTFLHRNITQSLKSPPYS